MVDLLYACVFGCYPSSITEHDGHSADAELYIGDIGCIVLYVTLALYAGGGSCLFLNERERTTTR